MPAPGGTTTSAAKRVQTSRNQKGQKIGTKGERTRRKLIQETLGLVESVGLRDVTVAEVAKQAGTSTATFYIYFEGVPEVVLAALEGAEQVTPEMMAMLDKDFSGAAGFARACRFVDAYARQWQKHGTVFRVRNLAAEEGDSRFLNARLSVAIPLMDALESKITCVRQPATGGPAIEPRAIAGAILIMLERLGAVGPVLRGDERTNMANMVLACAYLVQMALCPKSGE